VLRGKPVVVAWRGARSVVCAASYEARVFGVRSAMPAVRAERLCPDAVFVPPDFVRYKAVSKQVRGIFERHTDLIEPLSLDEAYLDVTVPKQDLGSATAIALSIRDAIREETQLTASAGIAPNKFLAKIASDWNKPDGQFVLKPAMVDAFLAPLAVGKLPGVGKVMEAKLAELGIATCTDLRLHGAEALEQRFGRWGRRLHELALGIDERAVQPERLTLQISAEDTFPEDLPLDALEEHIRRLASQGLGRLPARTRTPPRAHRPHRGAEAEDQRFPHADPQPHRAPRHRPASDAFADIGCGPARPRGPARIARATGWSAWACPASAKPDGNPAMDDLFG
jgi:DNA polymerase-4